MHLIVILLFTVSILTLLSGAIVFFGSKRGDRTRSAWFFVATLFATFWMVSISLFLIAEPSWFETISWHVNWTYISALFIDIALLGYISWREKYGRILTTTFLVLGLILTGIFLADPSLLYNKVILTNAGNSLETNIGPFYFAYIAFFCLLVPSVIITLFRQIYRSRSKRTRGADLVLLIGFAISGTMSLVFNLILPLWDWSLIWLGPLAISTTIIAFYYTILRYRTLNLASIWLRIFSYVVIVASIAIIYMIIFSLVFAALFRGSTPSTEVIILNFIMILVFIALMPAMNEFIKFVRSLISSQKTSVRQPNSSKEINHGTNPD